MLNARVDADVVVVDGSRVERRNGNGGNCKAPGAQQRRHTTSLALKRCNAGWLDGGRNCQRVERRISSKQGDATRARLETWLMLFYLKGQIGCGDSDCQNMNVINSNTR